MREMHDLGVREERRLIMLDNMALGKILDPKNVRITGDGEKAV